MPPLTIQRVVVVSLFLPNTVDFKVSKDKEAKIKRIPENPTGPVPNLIEVLAASNKPRPPKTDEVTEKLFPAAKGLEPPPRSVKGSLTQPRSRARLEETSVKLPSPLSISHTHQRRPSIDTAKIFEEAPWTVEESITGNIGLTNAINSVKDKLSKQIWVGTLGMPTDALTDKIKADIKAKFITEYDSYPVIVGDREFEGHYNHYCKQVLWPTFHYVIPDDPKSRVTEDQSWPHYVALNEKFAETVVENYEPGDIIWINDYHLMLLPNLLRKRLPNAIIGFFLHIPFPSSELFRCLPTRREILEGLLGADLIGFQTYSFARHFLQTCSRILALETNPTGILMENNYVSVGIFPIGVDIDRLSIKRNAPEVSQWMALLTEKYNGKKLVVAREKLDYIKGVRQKMLGFEQFLARHPEMQGEVVMIQVALSTNEQNEDQVNIADVVNRINSKYSSLAYQPVVYLHQDISTSQYLALLTSADVCLITSLRDGMNLTSHEYVVCQELKNCPLVLSEFTGTYGSFGAAIRINPWDTREIADGIYEALVMPEDDKKERWKELYDVVSKNTAQFWAESFISELEKAHEDKKHSVLIQHLQPKQWIKEFHRAEQRVIFLDYDGTIQPFQSAPATYIPPRQLVDILTKLTSNPRNIVYVMSGRMKDSLDLRLGSVPNLGLCAENGCFIKAPGSSEWENLFPNVDVRWMNEVKKIFEYYEERTPGAFIETKEVSLVWHYRMADNPGYGAWQAAELQNHIEDAIGGVYPIHCIAGNKNLEVLPTDINKSAAAKKILESLHPSFILAFGDDRADEDLFFLVNSSEATPNKITCIVGSKSSEAQFFVAGVSSVLGTLEMISEY